MEEQVKRIPYGKARFEDVRTGNFYYVDKTMYLPQMEDAGDYLFLIRPRRFGKSMFVSMLRAYYDIAAADRFDRLFGGLWIHEHPTLLKNSFQVIYFDFSLIGTGKGIEDLERNFNSYCGITLDTFAETYAKFYDESFVSEVKSMVTAGDKLNYINSKATARGYSLYLIIDEYDNFTNVILSDGGKEMFRNLTHASGFYREYFKIFKAMFCRVFLIGVSPVTLDDLSSGYNIDWNISQDPRFNHMLGFTETDVEVMLRYYKEHGKLRTDADIEAMTAEMKPWYNNYCFSQECLRDARLYNCDMVFYYLNHQIAFGKPPKEMVDKNIRTDYRKLRMLADIDRGSRREDRMSVVEEIAANGSITMKLRSSFPAEHITEDENFRSLLYYYGLLTMDREVFGELRMVVPNNCVQEQYWTFMRDYYRRSADMDTIKLSEDFYHLAADGEWRPLVERIAVSYRELSSVRDASRREHDLQGFFKAYLALSPLYLVRPEIELNYGYGDLLLLPDKARYPEVAHSYVIELKYLKAGASEAETEKAEREAGEQLRRYAADKALMRLIAGTALHLITIVFRGPEMIVCTELSAS